MRFFKKILIIFALATIFMPSANAQVAQADTIVERIIGTLQTTNIDSLSTYFNHRIELSLPDFSGISSSKHSQLLLSDFFKKNQPASFNVISRSHDSDSFFVIGTMFCESANYRVSFLTKKQHNQQFIYQLSIE